MNADSPLVMVVDDDHDVLTALAEVLDDAGYRVITAESGAHALAELSTAETLPDLLLVDLMMPGIDGWGLAARVREDRTWAFIPLVVMTAHGTKVLASAPVAAGYLTKPIHIDGMLAMVQRAIDLRSARPRRTSGVRMRAGDDALPVGAAATSDRPSRRRS